jgi:hypothetical protein
MRFIAGCRPLDPTSPLDPLNRQATHCSQQFQWLVGSVGFGWGMAVDPQGVPPIEPPMADGISEISAGRGLRARSFADCSAHSGCHRRVSELAPPLAVN